MRARPAVRPSATAGTTTRPMGSQASTITIRPTPTAAANRLFCVLVASRIAEGRATAITAAADLYAARRPQQARQL